MHTSEQSPSWTPAALVNVLGFGLREVVVAGASFRICSLAQHGALQLGRGARLPWQQGGGKARERRARCQR